MPVLSMFYGIIVRMYKENTGKHHMPHIAGQRGIRHASAENYRSETGKTIQSSSNL